MQINNNYTYNQPSFGKLKAIYLHGLFDNKSNEYALNVIKTFKESEAFTNFCKKYDVRATFESHGTGYYPYDLFDMAFASLKLEVEECGGFFKKLKNYFKAPVEIEFLGVHNEYSWHAKENLAKILKKTSFSDIEKMYLDEKNGTSKEALQKKQVENEFDKTINSLLKD